MIIRTSNLNKIINVMNRQRKTNFTISKLRFDASKINVQAFVKGGRPLMRILMNSLIPVGGRRTSNWARVMVLFLRQLNLLHKSGGIQYTVLYLKACSVLLQQASAGYIIPDLTDLKCRVSRDKSGFPRLIPSYHRKMIRAGDKLILRQWLTLFSLYRNLLYPGQLKLSSITNPSKATSRASSISEYIPSFCALLPESGITSLSQFSSLFPQFASGPMVIGKDREYNSSIVSIQRTKTALIKLGLNDPLLKLAELCYNQPVLDLWRDVKTSQSFPSNFIGKIAIKEEGAGKVRLFAMVDPWTQWVLRPLHKWVFNFLKALPMDGTFDQEKALKRAPFGRLPLYSYDLSSATDRLPISLQASILSRLFNEDFASNWQKLLVDRNYKLPSKIELGRRGIIVDTNYPVFVRYRVGQPMGALSSWAMLALTHHYIVQYCAWSSGVVSPKVLFQDYSVLGDDILIWNRTVARKYLRVLKTLGVDVGLSKSVISEKGEGVEFAKRTVIQGVDVSPVPFLEQSAAHRNFASLRSFGEKYSMSPNQALRFLGYGYKVDLSKNNSTIRKLRLGFTLPRTSFEMTNMFRSFLSERPYFQWKMKSFVPEDQVYRAFFQLVVDSLNKNLFKVKELEVHLSQLSAETWVKSIGPWGTEDAKIFYRINGGRILTALKSTRSVLASMKSSLNQSDVLWLIELYSSIYWSIPYSIDKQKFHKMIPHLVNLWFESERILAEFQLSRLTSPTYSPSKSNKFMEEMSVLRAWNRWEVILQKTTGLPDRAVIHRPLSKKLNKW